MREGEGCRGCCQEEFKARNFLLDHESPVLFMRAQWKWPVWIYPLYQTLFAIAFTVIIIMSGFLPTDWYMLTESDRIKWFIYMTNQHFFILTVCTIYQAGVAIYASVRWRERLSNDEVLVRQPWFLKAEWVIYNVSRPLAVMVSVLYWSILVPTYTSPPHWMFGVTHGFNAAYVILDIFITGVPMRILHVWHSMFFVLLYLIFTVIYDVTGGTNAEHKPYIYYILDWTHDTGWAAFYSLLVLFVALPTVWLMLYGLYAFRLFISWKTRSKNPENAKAENSMDKISHENPAFKDKDCPKDIFCEQMSELA